MTPAESQARFDAAHDALFGAGATRAVMFAPVGAAMVATYSDETPIRRRYASSLTRQRQMDAHDELRRALCSSASAVANASERATQLR